jgi:hypothetical protein
MSKKYVIATLDIIKAQTEKAICIEGRWFPKSQIKQVMYLSDGKISNVYEILIPQWLWLKSSPTTFLNSTTLEDFKTISDGGKECFKIEEWIMNI